MKSKYFYFLLIFLIILIDQSIKIYIKTNFYYHQEIFVFGLSWFRLHFVENIGGAFGLSYGGYWGKFSLTLVRILTATAMIFYLNKLVNKKIKAHFFLISLSLIIGGAIGNILDSVFYGVFFTESHFHEGVAQFTPWGHGYSSFFHGKVVDMFYFPIISKMIPESWPIIGGRHFSFLQAIFNFADITITLGIFSMVLFYKKIVNVTGKG